MPAELFRLTPWLALLLAWLPAAADAGPRIEQWTTPNGARVLFIAAPALPMVDIELVFDAGSARDGALAGLAALTNGLLAEGAGELSADAIADAFERRGARFGSEAERDMASVSLRSLTDRKLLEPALEVFATLVARPRFDPAAFDRELARMRVGLQAEQQSPGDLAAKAFYRALYGEHPYGSPPDGTAESLAAIDRAAVADFHRRYYVAANAVVAIVGDLDRAAAEALATRVTVQLPAGSAAPPLPPVPPVEAPRRVHVEYASAQTHLLIGQPGLSRDDADYFPLYLANHVFGGSGLVSRLSNTVREERGLAYSVYSYFLPMRGRGPFQMGLQTRADQVDEAIALLQQSLAGYVETGPRGEELEFSRRSVTGGFPMRIDSNRKLVGYLAVIGFYGLDADYLDRFIDRVRAVTLDQVKDALRRRLDPGRLVTVTVGPAR